ncbi:MAG: helix-turn-helix domain-containing protein [Campylobacteraceae bacterium]|jgi:hypothetical protein|nr:helix-turn-helix domain-containing protein [Campylobacteraceae bacterium]MBT3882706.1 helix-turn-helix domain-containing protein [Campylobacteraceae bacterium]MBT4030432.1 helix-turn-helix domain-containing protein [Campylobacteraceae bacterium]MBT4178997.1 helix-turn-helix domain-containing protein [Campylobacteraceae bacterium]MBT4573004.1 helix-turn-helix domain-containing protein [Campylobacteraceae bacterium]
MNSGQRLVTSAQAAQILNLSVQGVHYRIKNGQLKAIKKDGRTLVYINEQDTISTPNNSLNNDISEQKDIHIKLLKKYLKQMKHQYENEIKRLEMNQEQIISVFKSEISLLQSAFNEMKNIYALEHKNNNDSSKMDLIDIKDFFLMMRKYNKTDLEIKSIILDKIKSGDKRFIYSSSSKSIIIYKSDFLDLI